MFNIKVNGEIVHSIEEGRVTNLAVMSSKGAIGEAAIDPEQGEINVVVTMADPSAIHLYDLQAQQSPKNMTAEDIERLQPYPPVQPNADTDLLTSDTTTANEGLTPTLDPNTPQEGDPGWVDPNKEGNESKFVNFDGDVVDDDPFKDGVPSTTSATSSDTDSATAPNAPFDLKLPEATDETPAPASPMAPSEPGIQPEADENKSVDEPAIQDVPEPGPATEESSA